MSAAALASWPRLGNLQARGPFEGVESGTLDMTECVPHAARFNRLYHWLYKQLKGYEVEYLYFEATLPSQKQKSGPAGAIALGFAGIVQAVGWDFNCIIVDPEATTVKKHFCNHGMAQKLDVLRACRARGWEPKTTDEADALALADYAAVRILNRGRGRG